MPFSSFNVITRAKYSYRWICHLQTRLWWMRQPDCDESGVGFGVAGAEKPTSLWSRHSILGSDGTWLPEWSGKLGGVKRCAVRSRGVSWGKPVFRLTASVQHHRVSALWASFRKVLPNSGELCLHPPFH